MRLHANGMNVFQRFVSREWQHGHSLCRHGKELNFTVVSRNSVGSYKTTLGAAVDDGPFSSGSDPNRYRFHQGTASRTPVTRFQVHMTAPKTVGAVVSVFTSACWWSYSSPAFSADKSFVVINYISFMPGHVLISSQFIP